MNTRSILLTLLLPVSVAMADWPQWRGPQRNGILTEGPALLKNWSGADLKQLWDSEAIPSNDDGGLSSVVVAGGRAYVSVVWHREEPSETRQIGELVNRQLGYQSTGGLGPELVKKMEETRLSLSPTLRGKKLEDFTKQWIEENLNTRQKALYSGYVSGRFKKGALAMPIEVLDKLAGQQQRIFANEAELKTWLAEQGWSEAIQAQILAAVPPTKRVAEDTVLCLDINDGKTLWKTAVPGEPTGRGSSSTPCVAEGKVFALGSTQAHAVDATTGKVLWSAPLPQKGPGSSPLYVEGKLIINAKHLLALDAATGKELWKAEKAGGGQSSPAIWSGGGKTLAICNGRQGLDAVDVATGEIAWTTPGGGDSTPAISGDLLAAQVRKPTNGFAAFRISATSAQPLWHTPFEAVRTQASPIIHGDYVFHADDNVQQCWDVISGSQRWKENMAGSISSPAMADGKLFVMVNNGNNVQVLAADGSERRELGKVNVKAAWCPSPTIADGRLLLRLGDRVRCYSLTE